MESMKKVLSHIYKLSCITAYNTLSIYNTYMYICVVYTLLYYIEYQATDYVYAVIWYTGARRVIG